ncbi:MAG: hypothetical protein K6U00_04705 [Armatimonadetes bacterium]|nr:hypothetical protein [Armatimonadota bacterium]
MQRRHMLLPALVGLLALCAIAPLAHATPPSSEVPLPTQAAHTSRQDREGAARAIIREGERANDVTDPAGALALFEKAIEQYPDTEVVRFAYVRKAETLVYLDRCDEAIQLGRWVIEKYPKTKPACWAQFWVGQALLKKGERLAGMTALRGVNGLLPDRNDLTPLDLSRWVLGELCEPQYLLHKDIGDVMSFLGMGRDDAQSRAEVYAILAAYRGRDGRIDRGNSFIGRLERECADQKVEQDWAKAKVAASYLDKAGTDGEFVNLAIGMLQPILTNNNDDAAAQGCLSLARFYRRGNLSAKAEEVLRAGKERFLATSHGAEILYELATLLTKQRRDTEA